MPQLSKNVYRINRWPDRLREDALAEDAAELFFRGEREFSQKRLPPELKVFCFYPIVTKTKKYKS